MDYSIGDNQPDCEALLSGEVEELLSLTKQLLSGKMKQKVTMECAEPDFEFVFYPATDNEKSVGMDILIAFWDRDGALSANSMQFYLVQEDIEQLYEYLKLVCNSPEVNLLKLEEMRTHDILINR